VVWLELHMRLWKKYACAKFTHLKYLFRLQTPKFSLKEDGKQIGTHYRRILVFRLQRRTKHKHLKRNLPSALPDLFRFENIFFLTIDSFVCKQKNVYYLLWLDFAPVTMKWNVTIYIRNIFSKFANLSIF